MLAEDRRWDSTLAPPLPRHLSKPFAGGSPSLNIWKRRAQRHPTAARCLSNSTSCWISFTRWCWSVLARTCSDAASVSRPCAASARRFEQFAGLVSGKASWFLVRIVPRHFRRNSARDQVSDCRRNPDQCSVDQLVCLGASHAIAPGRRGLGQTVPQFPAFYRAQPRRPGRLAAQLVQVERFAGPKQAAEDTRA